jgi:argininosuccinate lyase
MTYNKDLQEDKEGLFDTVRTVSLCVRMTRRVLEKTVFRSESMRRAAETGYLNATELADYLAERGIPFRDAHHLVGQIVRRAIELHLELDEVPLAEFRRFSELFGNDVYERLKPETAVSRRLEAGGTSPAQVRRAIRALRVRLRRS